MKKKIKYTNEKIYLGKRVKDFLPSPDEILHREKNVKVTLNLSEHSVKSLKKLADKNDIPYQVVIRNLVDKFIYNYQSAN